MQGLTLKEMIAVASPPVRAHIEALEAELAALKKVNKALEENQTLGYHQQRERAEKAEAELAEIYAQHKTVMDETCTADEKHCTCVPVLRRMVEQHRGLLLDVLHYMEAHGLYGFTDAIEDALEDA